MNAAVRPFRILEPASVAEGSELLLQHGEAARIYAGGTELLLVVREGMVECEYLVNIKTIPGLDGLEVDPGRQELRIGALVTHRSLEHSAVVREHLPVLARAERDVANVRVRNVGTIGGNLCFAEPHADPGVVLVAHDARVVLQSAAGERELPLERFYVDSFAVALQPGEVLTEIRVPVKRRPSGAAYLRFAFRERPSVGVCVVLVAEESREAIGDARVAVGAASPVPMRIPQAEAGLVGSSLTEAASRAFEVGSEAAAAVPATSDLYGSEAYKRHLVRVLVGRAVREAAARLRGRLHGSLSGSDGDEAR